MSGGRKEVRPGTPPHSSASSVRGTQGVEGDTLSTPRFAPAEAIRSAPVRASLAEGVPVAAPESWACSRRFQMLELAANPPAGGIHRGQLRGANAANAICVYARECVGRGASRIRSVAWLGFSFFAKATRFDPPPHQTSRLQCGAAACPWARDFSRIDGTCNPCWESRCSRAAPSTRAASRPRQISCSNRFLSEITYGSARRASLCS